MGYTADIAADVLPALSEQQVILVVAILEERRLNDIGLLATLSNPRTDAETRWGLLRGADIPHSLDGKPPQATATTAVQRSSASLSSTPLSACSALEAGNAAVNAIIAGVQAASRAAPTAGLGGCNVHEKIAFVAMYRHRNVTDRSIPYTFSSATSILAAVEGVLSTLAVPLGDELCRKTRNRLAGEIRHGTLLATMRQKGLVERLDDGESYASAEDGTQVR